MIFFEISDLEIIKLSFCSSYTIPSTIFLFLYILKLDGLNVNPITAIIELSLLLLNSTSSEERLADILSILSVKLKLYDN